MASAPFDDISAAHERSYDEAPRERSLGEHIFIWVAWALAAAFWGLTMTTFAGILRSVFQPGPGAADARGVAGAVIYLVGGLIVLGLAMAYGSWMFARRNRSLDPTTEAATAALYDRIERQGGDDMTSRSPDPARQEGGIR